MSSPVSDGDMQPGDILRKTSHVAICIRGDQYIHMPQPGDALKVSAGIGSFRATWFSRLTASSVLYEDLTWCYADTADNCAFDSRETAQRRWGDRETGSDFAVRLAKTRRGTGLIG